MIGYFVQGSKFCSEFEDSELVLFNAPFLPVFLDSFFAVFESILKFIIQIIIDFSFFFMTNFYAIC